MHVRQHTLTSARHSFKFLNVTLLSILLLSTQTIGLGKRPEASRSGTEVGVRRMATSYGEPGQAAAQEVRLKGDEVLKKYFEMIAENPKDDAAWIKLQRVAESKGIIVWQFYIPIQAKPDVKSHKLVVNEALTESPFYVAAAWILFGTVKEKWVEKEYLERHPSAKGYRFSFEEEYDAFEHLAVFWEEVKKRESGLSDNKLDILVQIYKNDLLDAYIYLQDYHDEFDDSYKEWRGKNPEKLVRYFNEYVLIPKADVPDYVARDITANDSSKSAGEHESPSANASYRAGSKADPERAAQWRKGNAEQFRLLKKLNAVRRKTRGQLLAQANAYSAIGSNFQQLEEYQSSLSYLNKALRLRQRLNDALGLCQSYDSIGHTYLSMGDYEKALPLKEEAVSRCQSLKGNQEVYISALMDLGFLYSTEEDFSRAVEYVRRGYLLAGEGNHSGLMKRALTGFFLIYSNAFKSISWNLKSGIARESKAEDFVNDDDVGEGVEKYGRKNPEEDLATFGTLAAIQNFRDHGREAGRLTKHVRAEMLKGNFAPAAKYLFFKYVYTVYTDTRDVEPMNAVAVFGRREMSLPSVPSSIDLDAIRGNIQPSLDWGKRTGLFSDEEIEEVKNSYMPVADDITFDEVNSNLRKATAERVYIPARIIQMIGLFEDAQRFAREQKLDVR